MRDIKDIEKIYHGNDLIGGWGCWKAKRKKMKKEDLVSGLDNKIEDNGAIF